MLDVFGSSGFIYLFIYLMFTNFPKISFSKIHKKIKQPLTKYRVLIYVNQIFQIQTNKRKTKRNC